MYFDLFALASLRKRDTWDQKTRPRPGFCASFGCYDSRGWPACCGPCPSPVSKCLEEAFSTSLNVEKPQFWPGDILGVGELNCGCFRIEAIFFLKRKISLKRKGTWVYCGFSKASKENFQNPLRLMILIKGMAAATTSATWKMKISIFFHVLYRMDFCEYWSFDIFGLDCIYIYLFIYLYMFIYIYIHI